MRKRFLTKALAFSMAATMLLTSVPVQAAEVENTTAETAIVTEAAAETDNTDSDVEYVVDETPVSEDTESDTTTEAQKQDISTENATEAETSEEDVNSTETAEAAEQEVVAEEKTSEIVDDLFDVDLNKVDSEVLNNSILAASIEDVAVWWSTLSDTDKDIAKEKAECLTKPYELSDDYCKECGLTAGTYDTMLELIKGVIACDHHIGADTLERSSRAVVFYMYNTETGTNQASATIDFKLPNWNDSGFVKTNASRHDCTWSGPTSGTIAIAPTANDKKTWKTDSSKTNYESVTCTTNFQIPANYYIIKAEIVNFLSGTAHCACQSVSYNTSGKYLDSRTAYGTEAPTSTATRKVPIIFNTNYVKNILNKPDYSTAKCGMNVSIAGIPYKVAYSSSGANAGTTVTDSLKATTAGNIPTAASKGIKKTVKLSLNANGGTVSQTTLSADCAQASWKCGTATYNNGTALNNIYNGSIKKVNGSATLTPVFGNASITNLPKPTAPSYTITYNKDGNTSQESAYATFTKWTNGTDSYAAGGTWTGAVDATLTANYTNPTITLPSPTKEGYAFSGWNIGGTVYKGGETITLNGNKTATAVFVENGYLVSYDKNAEDAEGNTEATSAKFDSNVTIAGCGFSRKGYAFKGWAKTPKGAVVYGAGDTVKNLTAENGGVVTLYAVWEAIPTKITFDNKDGSSYISFISLSGTEEIALPGGTRTGYKFLGWTDKSNGTEVVYLQGDMYSALSGDITLYGVWMKEDFEVDFSSIYEKIANLEGLTKTEIAKLAADIQSKFAAFGATDEQMTTLLKLLQESTLSANEKLDIIKKLQYGFLTEEDYNKLLGLVNNSDLAEDIKDSLIELLGKMSKAYSKAVTAILDEIYNSERFTEEEKNYFIKLIEKSKELIDKDNKLAGLIEQLLNNPNNSYSDIKKILEIWFSDGISDELKAIAKGLVESGASAKETNRWISDITDKNLTETSAEQLKEILRGVDVLNEDIENVIDGGVKPNVIIIPDQPGNSEDIRNIYEILKGIKNTSELTKKQIEELESKIKSLTGTTDAVSSALVELVIKSNKLTEQQKLTILSQLANGYLSESMKKLLIDVINSSNLPNKNELLESVKNISSLTYEQQKQLLAKLLAGSSITWKASDGITYILTKNSDGTLTASISSLNGKTAAVVPGQITIAGTVYPVTKIADNAFKGNKSLKSIVIPGNITVIGKSAFEGCTALATVKTNSGLVTISSRAFYGCTALTSFVCPGTLIKICSSAFEGCSKLKTVTFNNGLLQIESKAFYKCKAFEKISIPKTVLEIQSYAFANCSKLKYATFANYSDSKVKTLGKYIFANDTSLKKIKIPSRVTAIPTKAFYKCTALTSVSGMSGVTLIGTSAFEGCKKISKVTIPSKVQKINSKAFYKCSKLKTVTVKSKGLTKVGKNAFKKCKKGIKIKCPNSKIKTYNKLFKGKY